MFQFSIGDAADTPQGYPAPVGVAVSILYWRCQGGFYRIAEPHKYGFNSLLEMPVADVAASVSAMRLGFNSLLEMRHFCGKSVGLRNIGFQFSIGDAGAVLCLSMVDPASFNSLLEMRGDLLSRWLEELGIGFNSLLEMQLLARYRP